MHILHEKYSTVPNKRVYMAIYFGEKFGHIQEKRQKNSLIVKKSKKFKTTVYPTRIFCAARLFGTVV